MTSKEENNFSYGNYSFYQIKQQVYNVLEGLGLITNILILIVYFQPKLRLLTLSIYIRCMAVFYILEIIRYFIYSHVNIFIGDLSSVSCIIYTYSLYIFFSIGIWFEVIAGYDRLLTIVFPTRFKFIQNKKFQYAIIAAIIFYNFVFYAKIFHGFHTRFVWDKFVFEFCDAYRESILLLNFVNSTAMPFFLLIISSLATIFGVYRTHKRSNITIGNKKHLMLRARRDLKFAVTMISLNLVFVCLVAPVNSSLFFSLFDVENAYGFFLTNILFRFYFLMNFFIQLFVNNIVRKEFFKCIKILPMFLKQKFIHLYKI